MLDSPVKVAAPPAAGCPTCNREPGPGVACQFCRQLSQAPSGVRISSAGKRLGAHLLDGVLMFCTLFFGWVIWSLLVYSKGQTPGKQLMGMRTVKLATGQRATFGTMFVREWIAKPVIAILGMFTFGIINFWLCWDGNTQELWDKMVSTVVVDDRGKQV